MNARRLSCGSGTATRTRRQGGFSLVELMLALTLGLVIIGGVISIFLTNQQAFRTTEGLSRLQENARISFELMARELRQAGGNPCGTKFVANMLKTNDWSTDWDAGTIQGYESTVAAPSTPFGTAAAERFAGTDAIRILSDSLSIGAGITAHDTAANPPTITLTTSNAALPANTIVLICDNNSAAIAQVSGLNGTNAIEFNTSGSSPGSCDARFGYYAGGCASPKDKTFATNGFVSALSAGIWYVGNNGRGGRSLYRRDRSTSVEVAEGVVNMQIQYLLRTEPIPPATTFTLATNWVDASTITNWTAGLTTPQVVGLRFRLTLETVNRVGTNQTTIQREMVYVVNLRNRLE